MSAVNEAPVARSECPIQRCHQRFLLRTLEFSQQYAPMYRCRMIAQTKPALAAIRQQLSEESKALTVQHRRVLELVPGVPSLCVGVVYKNMKLLPKFLDEYQRELVRIDAGEEDNDEDGAIPEEEMDEALPEASPIEQTDETASVDEHFNVCHEADELFIEDNSGRVVLHGLRTEKFCTGVVLGIYGTLLPNGHLCVHKYAFCGLRNLYVPRPLPRLLLSDAASEGAYEPCYIGFICGLNLRSSQQMGEQDALRQRTMLDLLTDFIGGNLGDESFANISRHISRLVIGGNSIASTEEQKLKKKVKLDPSDHAKLNDDKSSSGVVTSARLMTELDSLLVKLASSVEVELMPGDNDMSDAFQPQQPLHPVLLPNAARYSSLRLVSNPFEFVALTSDVSPASTEVVEAGVRVLVTSGQNLNDVARETNHNTRLQTMEMMLASGCACPTAPNTLPSYPFIQRDPFLFERAPHCFVACDQPLFETRMISLRDLEKETSEYVVAPEGENEELQENIKHDDATDDKSMDVRLICVPSFERCGTLVLMDVNSSTLDVRTIELSLT